MASKAMDEFEARWAATHGDGSLRKALHDAACEWWLAGWICGQASVSGTPAGTKEVVDAGGSGLLVGRKVEPY